MRSTDRALIRGLCAALAVFILAGCAAERRDRGLDWVESQAAERRDLEARGFPQFTGAN